MQLSRVFSSQRNSHQGGSSNWHRRRLNSKDLPSVRRLGEGLSGFLYETTWNESKYVRKDFPLGSVHHNVFEKEAIALLDLEHPNIVMCSHYTVGKSSCSLLLQYVDDDLQNFIQKRIDAQGKGNRTGSSTDLHSRVLNIDETRILMSSKAKGREIARADVGLMKIPENELTVPFALPEALDIILQIATGVEYLHDNGIVHGDLKPKNVLVGYGGIVKLVDFGLLETKKSIKLVSKHRRHFEVLIWKAPELFTKILGPVTEDSDDPFTDSDTDEDEEVESSVTFTKSRLAMADVYSFGLICSQILGGKLMYSNLSLNQLREQRTHGFRPQLPSTCPNDLQSLIFSSVERDPWCRPTFTDICTALKAFQSNRLPLLMEETTVTVQCSQQFHMFGYPPNIGAEFMEIDGSRSSEPIEDHYAWEMVKEPISQVRQALETIKHVCTMSSGVCVNKHECKRIVDRFSSIGEGLKVLVKDKNFRVGNASDGSSLQDYPAFDELLTVLRKGEALVSSYIDSKGIISVGTRSENRELFKEIHEELDTLKAQFDFESFSKLGQAKDFESSSGVERTSALAEDVDQDLKEMPEDMAQIKNSKNTTGVDMEKATLVVLEKSGLLGPWDELRSNLKIDPTAIKIEEPVRSAVLTSKRDKADEVFSGTPNDLPEWAQHQPPATEVNQLKKLEVKVKMCCRNCEEEVKDCVGEMNGVFALKTERLNNRVTILEFLGGGLDHEKLLRRLRSCDRKARFLESPSSSSTTTVVAPNPPFEPRYYMVPDLPSSAASSNSPFITKSSSSSSTTTVVAPNPPFEPRYYMVPDLPSSAASSNSPFITNPSYLQHQVSRDKGVDCPGAVWGKVQQPIVGK